MKKNFNKNNVLKLINKKKTFFTYNKKVIIKDLILNLKLGYYNFEKQKTQKVKFNVDVEYKSKKPFNDSDIKSIVNYGKIVKLISKLVDKKHYNFLEILAEDIFDQLFKDKRINEVIIQIEKLEILKKCSSVGIRISKKKNDG